MICCNMCFVDPGLQGAVKTIGKKGMCPTCGGKNVFLYDTSKNSDLIPYFDDLVDIFTPIDKLPMSFPKGETIMLKDELINGWNIFNPKLNATRVYDILTGICLNKYSNSPEYFDKPVGIKELYDYRYCCGQPLL